MMLPSVRSVKWNETLLLLLQSCENAAEFTARFRTASYRSRSREKVEEVARTSDRYPTMWRAARDIIFFGDGTGVKRHLFCRLPAQCRYVISRRRTYHDQ